MTFLSRLISIACVTGALSLLTACSQAGTGPGPGSSQSPQSSGPDGPVAVTFVRSGGFAGVEDTVVVQTDGTVLVQQRGREPSMRTLTDAEFEDLQRQIREADIPSVAGVYRVAGADMFHYTVTVEGSTLSADEPAVPPTVQPLIKTLSGYVASPGT